MGNYVSCTLTHQTRKTSTTTKVILPNGEILNFHEPIKAAELMLESPNSFVVNSKSLRIGSRFSALNADEDLEFATVYVMFPMSRVNSVVTAADLGSLFITAKKIGRVVPETVAAPPRLKLEEIEEVSVEFKRRMTMCRSKKPLLDTIEEEHVCSR
ncbi:hypothetical protein HanRHA438_Chr12g0562291 [Helianthus annuus]|uniref:DUF4228 domain protein n=1 Tax=Helianthus annuus TaxID=4232 RepID=A0A251T3F8_HELAN|nr:uncharacterized protein LOC110893151 [Helianthus annuus]KAF5778738.1 hypothetical protein HanXRQr2_Chr12g0551011 [Helianthus annuus]KAJ0490104.1 hypothetical protein HanHA300_Chr12g0451571 [Helianthus annuus]KAJ0494196.1 hypothetical protein HanIR_Chr12g0594631 [Helianthus annuus]KAJ0506012.1 hypothetical protein HanHA89_Chr12g0477031 [Helianthus annuus]KAJ0675681.1 hypothetical protein HanLR1_Chr12g0453911 [Helianthus annuus]